jgi:HTH-type transcriptional regulator / antitoxin HipB
MIQISRIMRVSAYALNMNHVAALVYDTAELGEQIRRVRVQRGLQQDELADRLGVTRMTVSRLERGQSVSVDTALRALSECGYAIAVAPKFTRVAVVDGD